jgi:hypothetical protein
MPNCETCDRPLLFAWTDTHGVGQCTSCGTPYTIYHYEDHVRVKKPPESCVADAWKPFLVQHWKETGRPIPSGYSFGIGGYEVANKKDCEEWHNWCETHRSELPQPIETSNETTI